MSDESEHQLVIRALKTCSEQHPQLVRLSDLVKHTGLPVQRVAEVTGDLVRQGTVRYNLKTGFALESTKPTAVAEPKPAPPAPAPPPAPRTEQAPKPAGSLFERIQGKALAEGPPSYSGGIGGRAVGARTLFPLSFQTITDLSQQKYERMQRADQTRQMTRNRLRELAQETVEKLARRPLKPLDQ